MKYSALILVVALLFGLFGCKSASSDDIFKAARKGDSSRVSSLLLSGISPDAQDRRGMTPLHFAAIGGHAEIIKTLLAKGANLNLKNEMELRRCTKPLQITACRVLKSS